MRCETAQSKEYGEPSRRGETGDDAGNNLVEETDARGHKTTYTVDGDTSRNEEVTDRLGNKTAYEYDDSGRTTKVTSKDADGTELAHVSYAYDTFDNMTEIVRGDGMKYALAYNNFHNLESIGIEGKDEKLIQYTYKNGNGRLKEMKYANGDTMKATYNSIGQMVGEKWLNSNGAEIARYKYVYDGEGNIVRSIDISGKKEYNYEYEEGRIIRATEADIELSDEIVTSKVIINTVKYYYDAEGKMTKKVITFSDNSTHTVHYENSDDNTVVKFDVPDTENANKKQTVTSHSKTDSFGRKVFDELQIGRGFVSRQFSYMPGAITDEHKKQHLIKSTATTQLVSQIALSDGRTISYEYDDEERIIKVTDTIDGTVSYTYDALGQLETETKDGKTTKFVYDNYGNISAKGVIDENGEIAEATKISYIYGNDTWKDLLTSYNGQSITYDAQGNPTNYLGHTLTWEKGRQLKKFVKSDGTVIDYTYNANGIRTSKKVNGVLHTYTLDGTKILRETWAGNTLIPLYDNEDGVCGILYNNVPYYFIKNLQGDIIAIVDQDAKTVARYSYDAWGVCSVAQDSVGIATVNPFRYRSYYFDEEIKLYYLQSRYYDATIGAFINADESVFGTCLAERIVSHNLFAYADNSPVINIDGNGFYSLAAYAVSSTLYAQMAAMSAAATSLMVSIKAFVAMIWNIFVVVSLLLIAIAAIIYICKTIGNVYSTVQAKTNVSKNEYKKFKNNICVYVLARKERKIGSVFYVGRTKNIVARYNAHAKTKGAFYMYVVYTCTSVAQSRVVEQCVLAGCLTGKFTSIIFGAAPSNRIKGISTKNAKKAISKLGKETADTISLLGCTAESDLLFMMNQ